MTLVSLEEARALLLTDVAVLPPEQVALGNALGRTLAEPVCAAHTQPAEPRATMDGIAVPDGAPDVGQTWQVIGETPAGGDPSPPLRAGEATRIATGAVVPEGAERVIQQERVTFSDGRATLNSAVGEARFIRAPGADFSCSEVLLDRGTRLGPAELGLAAAANLSSVAAVREPRVAIFATGDELVPPGSELKRGQSIDSASPMLAALVREWGGVRHAAAILPDDSQSISAALAARIWDSDILICIGGASVGARDLMRPAARAIGARFLFEGVAVQPGKPCWHARLGDGALILGLPGNPTSAFVCAHLLLRPLINRLVGRVPTPMLRAAFLAAPVPANGNREQYLRATASFDRESRLLATPLSDQDSGLQANLAKAQLLIRRPPTAGALEACAKVDVLELTRN